MNKINYIDYNALKEKYTMDEAAALVGVSVQLLWNRCIQYGVLPDINGFGVAELKRNSFRRIHYLLYYERTQDTDLITDESNYLM